ncbi:MAG: hypothetical protein ABH865_02815 [Candidatus Omnitrophota bacterium]|nr:hypothetical protein [Candidatus Omnitrophota bacterium]
MNKELFALVLVAGISILFIVMILKDRRLLRQHDQGLEDLRRFMKLKGFKSLDRCDQSLVPLITSLSRFGQRVSVKEGFVSKNCSTIAARVTCGSRHASSFFSDMVVASRQYSAMPDFVLLYLPQVQGIVRTSLEGLLGITRFFHLTKSALPHDTTGAYTLYCQDAVSVSNFLSAERLKRISAKSGFILTAEKGYFIIRALCVVNVGITNEQEVKRLLEIAAFLEEE